MAIGTPVPDFDFDADLAMASQVCNAIDSPLHAYAEPGRSTAHVWEPLIDALGGATLLLEDAHSNLSRLGIQFGLISQELVHLQPHWVRLTLDSTRFVLMVLC